MNVAFWHVACFRDARHETRRACGTEWPPPQGPEVRRSAVARFRDPGPIPRGPWVLPLRDPFGPIDASRLIPHSERPSLSPGRAAFLFRSVGLWPARTDAQAGGLRYGEGRFSFP